MKMLIPLLVLLSAGVHAAEIVSGSLITNATDGATYLMEPLTDGAKTIYMNSACAETNFLWNVVVQVKSGGTWRDVGTVELPAAGPYGAANFTSRQIEVNDASATHVRFVLEKR
jgi:hypothetical protein